MQYSLFATPQIISEQFMRELKKGDAMECPCCKRLAKLYKRTICDTQVKQLVKLYRAGGHAEWLHSSKVSGRVGPGSFYHLKYWGLIEAMPTGGEDSARGFWRITERGVDFINDAVRVPKIAHTYNDEVWFFSDESVGVRDALGNKFSYEELMK